MLLSTIIPVYKAEKFLPQLLEGLLPQLTNECEVILVDDDSPDNCGSICDEYARRDSRVKVIHKENGGASSARNAGLDLAKGEYITFVDSDDWVSDDYIETVLSFCTGEYDIVNFDFNLQQKDKSFVTSPSETKEIKYDSSRYFELLLSKRINSACSKIYKSSIIKEKKISFNDDIEIGEDYCFNLEYSLYANSFLLSNKAIYYYRYNEGSTTANIKLTAFKDTFRMFLSERQFIKIRNCQELQKESDKRTFDSVYYIFRCLAYSGYTHSQIAPYLKEFDLFQIPYSSLGYKDKLKKYLLANENFRLLGYILKINDLLKNLDDFSFR